MSNVFEVLGQVEYQMPCLKDPQALTDPPRRFVVLIADSSCYCRCVPRRPRLLWGKGGWWLGAEHPGVLGLWLDAVPLLALPLLLLLLLLLLLPECRCGRRCASVPCVVRPLAPPDC